MIDSKINERIIQYLSAKGMTAKTLERLCKLGNGTIMKLSGKTRESTIDRIISQCPDLNRDWLVTGEGEMLLSEKEEPAQDVPKDGRLIPFYDVETTGGYNGRVSASDVGSLKGYIQPGGWFDGRETAAIRHVGDSMVEYPDGCVLAVREVLDKHLLVPGRNYVIETREYRVTKRVQRGSTSNSIMLYSSNSEKYDDGRLIHEPFEIALEDVLHIFSVLGYIVNQSGEFRLIKP